jgi:ACR3 family arsenite efflux pump ArsB
MKVLQAHLNKWLLVYVVAVMALGIALGHPQTAWTGAHQGLVSALTTVAVFLIIYPMMVNLRFGGLLRAGKNIKAVALALLFNFVWAPLLGYGLVHLFFPHDPLLALGFLLVMVVPCSSMAIGYTGLSKGNLELATLVVALSFLLAVVAVPAWMTLFAASYAFPLPVSEMVTTILEVLLAPMLLGPLTRLVLVRWLGAVRFQRWQPLFPSISLLAMQGIIFLIFFSKATMIVGQWHTVLLLLAPNALFIALTLLVLTWVNKRLGLSYADNMAVVFASTGKNNGTAIAIASMAFSPMVAVPAATMPIFQILLMVLYLKGASRIRGYFTRPSVRPALSPRMQEGTAAVVPDAAASSASPEVGGTADRVGVAATFSTGRPRSISERLEEVNEE